MPPQVRTYIIITLDTIHLFLKHQVLTVCWKPSLKLCLATKIRWRFRRTTQCFKELFIILMMGFLAFCCDSYDQFAPYFSLFWPIFCKPYKSWEENLSLVNKGHMLGKLSKFAGMNHSPLLSWSLIYSLNVVHFPLWRFFFFKTLQWFTLWLTGPRWVKWLRWFRCRWVRCPNSSNDSDESDGPDDLEGLDESDYPDDSD